MLIEVQEEIIKQENKESEILKSLKMMEMKEINIGLEKPLFIPEKVASYDDDAICCDRVKGKVYEWVDCKNMDCRYCVYDYAEKMEKEIKNC